MFKAYKKRDPVKDVFEGDVITPNDVEDICEHCGGTGELSSMEAVYPGEPHMADIGTRPCICQIRDEDDYDPDVDQDFPEDY